MQPDGEPELYRQQAAEAWPLWRLVFEGRLTKEEVDRMDIEEITEANAALDLWIEAKNRANQRG